jgi:hypothetical protein
MAALWTGLTATGSAVTGGGQRVDQLIASALTTQGMCARSGRPLSAADKGEGRLIHANWVERRVYERRSATARSMAGYVEP